jgi:hypothetical protein
MKIHRTFFLLFLTITIGISEARSASVTIGASKDNSIFQNFPSNSGGGAAGIYVGGTATKSPRRGLIAFDVADNVPAGATITSVQLTLYSALGGGTTNAVELHRLSADWGEGSAGSDLDSVQFGGGGFDAAPGNATWNERFFGFAAWTNPGANGDFNPAASATALIGVPNPDWTNPTAYNWLSTPALVSDVQGWLDNSATNFGWILINSDETSQGTARAFFSRSATLDTNGFPLLHDVHPALTITYMNVVPEPAAGVLLIVSGTMLTAGSRRRSWR